MTIDCAENHTEVVTPTGHNGRLDITRRERKIISGGNTTFSVRVVGADGISRKYRYCDLLEVADEDQERFNEVTTAVREESNKNGVLKGVDLAIKAIQLERDNWENGGMAELGIDCAIEAVKKEKAKI